VSAFKLLGLGAALVLLTLAVGNLGRDQAVGRKKRKR
jgi:hypothetical protein